MADDTVSPAAIMQLGLGFWGSKALLSAVELGLFTQLGAGPLDLETLRQRLGLHPRSARDFFDALVALGMLERRDGVYANTAETGRYLDRSKPAYVGGILEMANRRLYRFWGRLSEALRSGEPQNEVRQGEPDLFEAIYADPATLESFLGAMTGISRPTAEVLAAAFPWRDYRSFVDVGCAQGGLTAIIAAAHPHLRGSGFDLPVVAPLFEKFARQQGLQQRLSFVAGDFFKDPLPQADVIVMGHILHDWNLPQKQALLARAYAALPRDGALIVYDAVIDDERRRNSFGLLMSLNMLIETQGGFDYTGADCSAWMKQAGFARTRVEPLDGPNSMVVGLK